MLISLKIVKKMVSCCQLFVFLLYFWYREVLLNAFYLWLYRSNRNTLNFYSLYMHPEWLIWIQKYFFECATFWILNFLTSQNWSKNPTVRGAPFDPVLLSMLPFSKLNSMLPSFFFDVTNALFGRLCRAFNWDRFG